MPMPSVRALSRGLAVMEVLSRSAQPLPPGPIAEAAGLDRGTTSRLLQTLMDDGYVRRMGQGRYALTSKLLELASSGGLASGLREIARPIMRELRDSYDETVHLGVVEGDRVVYIEKLEPSHQRIALVTSVGQSMPVHSTSLGKAILSGMSAEARDAILDRISFVPKTSATITSRDAYLAELTATAARGYAVDHGENLPDASCVAAPIRNSNGEVIAALSMSSPTFRIADRFEELGPAIRLFADRIANALGWRS